MTKTFLLLLTAFFIGALSLQAGEITQLTSDSNMCYRISVTQNGLSMGAIELVLFPEVAPKHCRNFDSLVSIKFYDKTAFHRVIPKFMIQGGDPNSKNDDKSTWGQGDPSQTTVPAEFNYKKHVRGIMSAARLSYDTNSATSQFFICLATYSYGDGKYSIYGQVLKGMEVADAIVNVPRNSKDNPNQKVEMTIEKIAPISIKDNILVTNSGIKIFPNPAADLIRFHSDSKEMSVSSVKISDIAGEEYYSESFASAKYLEDICIPVSSWPVGAYIIRITDTLGKTSVLKILVQ